MDHLLENTCFLKQNCSLIQWTSFLLFTNVTLYLLWTCQTGFCCCEELEVAQADWSVLQGSSGQREPRVGWVLVPSGFVEGCWASISRSWCCAEDVHATLCKNSLLFIETVPFCTQIFRLAWQAPLLKMCWSTTSSSQAVFRHFIEFVPCSGYNVWGDSKCWRCLKSDGIAQLT